MILPGDRSIRKWAIALRLLDCAAFAGSMALLAAALRYRTRNFESRYQIVFLVVFAILAEVSIAGMKGRRIDWLRLMLAIAAVGFAVVGVKWSLEGVTPAILGSLNRLVEIL